MFFCPMSWLIAIVVTRIARWVPLVEQDLFTIPEHMRSSPVFVLFLLGIAFLFTGHWFHCTFTRMKTTIDGGCLIRSRNCLLFASTWVHPHFLYCGFLVCLFLFCVLCAQCYHYLWFVHSWLSIRFSLKLIYTWCMCNKRTESLWPYVCFIKMK
jgi:hypothetical protein